MTPILHHYEISNFSEKVRLAFGLKRMAWRSVLIPATAPKPDYEPLTGGYRRTPALQLGADVICDTRLILVTLEQLQPEPTLYPGGRGLHEAVASWAEGQLTWPAARLATGRNAEALPAAFHADRAAMHGRPPPALEQVRAAGERALAQLRPQLAWAADICAGARPFLLGERAGLADLSLYMALWFLQRVPRDVLAELAPDAALRGWMARVAALGHGGRSEITAEAALDEALDAAPPALEAGSSMDGFSPGDEVLVAPEEGTSPAVRGVVARLTEDEIAIRREHPRVGAVVVRFPRLRYVVRRA